MESAVILAVWALNRYRFGAGLDGTECARQCLLALTERLDDETCNWRSGCPPLRNAGYCDEELWQFARPHQLLTAEHDRQNLDLTILAIRAQQNNLALDSKLLAVGQAPHSRLEQREAVRADCA